MPTNPRPTLRPTVPLLVIAGLLAGCAPSGTPGDDAAATGEPEERGANAMDGLTESERQDGWRPLFDGESLDGWRQYGSEAPPEGWRAEEGTLHRYGPGGDIMTVDTFDDYELALEWRVAEGGNSGIFYHGRTGYDYIHDVAPEMQVLDDAVHPDGQNPLTAAGAVYGLYPAPPGVVRPAGEWNEVRILAHGDHVEHWLNGERIVEYELGSDEWQARKADSKFAGTEYGTLRSGHIGLQDHGDPVWFRNIRLRPLGGDEAGEAGP